MVISYNPLDDTYLVKKKSRFGLIMTVDAQSVRDFAAMLTRQTEAYQLLAYLGYGIAKAAAENDNPMLDAMVEKYGGRFDV